MDIVRESEIKDGMHFPKNILDAKKQYEKTLLSKRYFDFSRLWKKR